MPLYSYRWTSESPHGIVLFAINRPYTTPLSLMGKSINCDKCLLCSTRILIHHSFQLFPRCTVIKPSAKRYQRNSTVERWLVDHSRSSQWTADIGYAQKINAENRNFRWRWWVITETNTDWNNRLNKCVNLLLQKSSQTIHPNPVLKNNLKMVKRMVPLPNRLNQWRQPFRYALDFFFFFFK